MGVAKPVDLGSLKFRKQEDAHAHFKRMLNAYHLGDVLSPSDASELGELLKRHPEYDEKLGVGIERFEIMMHPEHPTRCFKIVRADGSKDHFSYPVCVTGRGKA